MSRANLALAYHYRGAEYLKTDRYDEAILDFDRAIALGGCRPLTAIAASPTARRAITRKRSPITAPAIRIWPNWHDWYFNRGLAYAAMGRHDEAIADFGKALFFKPDFADAHVARADSFLQKGQPIEALADYERALRERP